jgi:hypothetical protein
MMFSSNGPLVLTVGLFIIDYAINNILLKLKNNVNFLNDVFYVNMKFMKSK